MCQMLLSINPEYVTSILQGDKLYEYRKFRCRDDVDKIVIYEKPLTLKDIGVSCAPQSYRYISLEPQG